MQRDCSVEDDWWEKNVEEEVGSEQGERIHDVNPGDEKPKEHSQDDENTGFWQQLLQEGGMVEQNLEDKGSDDEGADFHLTFETACGAIIDVLPPPCIKVHTLSVMTPIDVTCIQMDRVVLKNTFLARSVRGDTVLMFLDIVNLFLHTNWV